MLTATAKRGSMRCTSCNTEIPAGQAICPACYRITGATSNRKSRNVIHFLSPNTYNGLFSGRVEDYFQPEFVLQNFYAETPDAFREITKSSPGLWNLLIIDPERATSSVGAISDFQTANAACVIAVLGPTNTPIPLSGVVRVSLPAELDDWQTMMNALLRLTPPGTT